MITKLNKMVEAGMAEKVMAMMVALMLVIGFLVMGMMAANVIMAKFEDQCTSEYDNAADISNYYIKLL